MVGTTPEIDQSIQEFGQRLAQRIRVDRILLFGSRARGEALHESDIDLAVISPDFGEMPFIRRLEFLARHWGYGPWAECFGYTPEELETAEELSFPGEIRRTGKVVFPPLAAVEAAELTQESTP